MPEYLQVLLRTMFAFFMLFVAARFLGKQTISKMTYFDFIASITMGAIIANLSFNVSLKAHYLALSFIEFTLIVFCIAFISLKNRKARKLFAGDPTVVIENGKILENNMEKMRYTLDYLNQQLREKDVFNIEEVLFAVIETNGTLTVLKKPEYRNVVKQDLSLAVQPEKKLPVELVMDGCIVHSNLIQNNLEASWVESEVKKRGLHLSEVVYAVLAANGRVYIDTYRDDIESPVDQEPSV
ncbi:DUF421 domain-containing protein [Bacillus badius]|uniref:YdfS n=1 Tax=Bacillus badius TaxID=1455 RepID=A0ABR5AWA2_BACBA|nr:DUF421 domain-containing protein [Bacillus badius]KIL78870.1 YdfS [Bacillus badius]KZR58928.1 hypothetical protein A3781_15435 [Bacillus badius]MED4717392.1 DUF421 domain-containing protein [Bacillus badius]